MCEIDSSSTEQSFFMAWWLTFTLNGNENYYQLNNYFLFKAYSKFNSKAISW
jgi:hypothetical protein